MKVEIELTKSEVDKLRRIIGIQTNTKADVVLKSFINTVIKDPHQLKIIQYEQRS
jgi:hypothetical protein